MWTCTHLGGVDELISKALRDRLDVTEGSLTSTHGDQVDGLVNTADGRNIHSLAADGTSATNAGRVFAGARVDDGVDEHLEGVLARDKVDNLKRLLEDAHSHQLLAVVAAVHHHRVGNALNNGALQ